MRRRWILAWLLATTVIAALTLLPASGYRAHAHWERVGWIPFADPRSRPWEMVANLALFLPFGWAGARSLGGTRVAAIVTCSLALLLSAGVELAQVFAHGRIASATDVAVNVAGAALGAGVVVRLARGDQRPVWVADIVASRSRSQR